MLGRLLRRDKSSRTNKPCVQDLLPEISGMYAEDAIFWLEAEHDAKRLDYYREPGSGQWFIWLSDAIVQGGMRIALKEWMLIYLVAKLSTLPGWECSVNIAFGDHLPLVGDEAMLRSRNIPDVQLAQQGGKIHRPQRGPRRSQRMLSLLAILGALTVSLVGCDLGISGGNTGGSGNTGTPTAVSTTPYRAHITLVDCNDSSYKYTPQLFNEANAYMADSLEKAVVPNQGGLTAFFLQINHQTTSVDSELPPLVIPSTPALPTPPTLTPTPTTDPNNPYGSGQQKQQVNDANNALILAYQKKLAQVQAQLSQISAQVHESADHLRTLNPPVDAQGASVWGCAVKASEYFAQAQPDPSGEQGQKVLVISSAMDETEWIDSSHPNLNFQNVKIRVLFYYCGGDSSFCQFKESTWRKVFTQAGATDIQFLDPAQSQALPPLFSPVS